jgi:flagellar motor switch protein FliN
MARGVQRPDVPSSRTFESFVEALLAELINAASAAVGDGVGSAPVATTPLDGILFPLSVSGDLEGQITIVVDREGAETLARRVLALDGTPDEATVGSTVREIFTAAIDALSKREAWTSVAVSLGDHAAGLTDPAASGYELQLGDVTLALIAVQGLPPAPPPAAEVEVPPVAAAEPEAVVSTVSAEDRLAAVLDIDLPLVVRFGQTVMTLKALAVLGPGALIDMGGSPDDPVQMLVGDHVIARGEVVVVDGNYGIRILDLISPADRARALEV